MVDHTPSDNFGTVCVVGLGYVGLPVALEAAAAGLTVIGFDIDAEKTQSLQQGVCPIEDARCKEHLSQHSSSIQFVDQMPSAPNYLICVPTPVGHDHAPDLTALVSAIKTVAESMPDGSLVCIESTVYPGVCEEIAQPILTRTGKSFALFHCPERVNPGDPKWHVGNIPRVLAGSDPKQAPKARALYQAFVQAEITVLSQIRAAEATKILENTFRDVNIAFVNEMAQSFHALGIDIAEVIRGASTKPFGFLPHYPGVGVGGHCIAVDPYYMIARGKTVGFDHDFLAMARRINSAMPSFTANLVQDALNELQLPLNGTTVSVLGLSYKPGIGDPRESPAFPLVAALQSKGADVRTYDPFLLNMSTCKTLHATLDGSECAVLVTAHSEFVNESLYTGVSLVVDGRNALDPETIRAHGTMYIGIGRR